MSGRLPIHVNQNNDCNSVESASGIDLRMTLLPQKLKSAGWHTAMVGKWHGGARTSANLPHNRGFDHHFGFLKGGEDHFKQNNCAGGPVASRVDLWEQSAPAFNQNGTYSAYIYANKAVQIINNFTTVSRAADPEAKLFLYLPWHDTHTPLEAPEKYSYPPVGTNNTFAPRLTYNAMSRALDDGMKNVTDAVKATPGTWHR